MKNFLRHWFQDVDITSGGRQIKINKYISMQLSKMNIFFTRIWNLKKKTSMLSTTGLR